MQGEKFLPARGLPDSVRWDLHPERKGVSGRGLTFLGDMAQNHTMERL